ncbi:hypothetical protein Sste5346_010418 [Sporothrix stenoceras]|uniref:Ergosterol biosynthesis protein n=1 Tax=Sporothrix stenoceras TaxID=5173 RepID=A0ABR3YG65_9PEZI
MTPYVKTSFSAVTHSVVSYVNPIASLRQFSGPSAPPKNALVAHVYGVKNIYTGLIRLYAAYQITNPELYNLTTLTFVGVLALYSTEHLIFRTVGTKEALASYVIATIGFVWMQSYRSWYLA